MGFAEMVPSARGLSREIAGEFPELEPRQCDVLAEFVSLRIARTNQRFNAMLLSKILMRLADANNSPLVPAALALAVGVVPMMLRRRWCKSAEDVALALDVPVEDVRREIGKTREFLYD